MWRSTPAARSRTRRWPEQISNFFTPFGWCLYRECHKQTRRSTRRNCEFGLCFSGLLRSLQILACKQLGFRYCGIVKKYGRTASMRRGRLTALRPRGWQQIDPDRRAEAAIGEHNHRLRGRAYSPPAPTLATARANKSAKSASFNPLSAELATSCTVNPSTTAYAANV